MESVIREGTLRLLTAESTCDVILSCQGRRLMAHKVILSVASPIFRDLFLENPTDPTVVILPDISCHIMTLILDYIYTGSVIIYSNTIQQFLSAAKLLQIKLDFDIRSKDVHIQRNEYFLDLAKNLEEETNFTGQKETITRNDHNKNVSKKLPELIPISEVRAFRKSKNIRRTNSCVLPSPWTPRIETVLGDPRDDILENSEYLMHQSKFYKNDSNNNFQAPDFSRCHKQNRNASDQLSPTKTTSTINFFKNISERSKFGNSANTTISRPPEDVEIDRDKPTTTINERLPSVKIWMTENFTKTDVSSTKICVPENSNRVTVNDATGEFSDDVKEELDDTIQCKYTSAVKTEETCVGGNELEQTSDKEKPYKCEQCGKHFSQLRNFKYHRSVHEGTKEFAAKCEECGKVFNDKGYLSSHMKIHRDRKEYGCPHCPKRFNQRVAYNMHLRIHTGVKPHECPTCGKSFSRKMLLKQHQRVHTGERPYSCPECGKTFADRSNMSLHARLHTGVKPYACSMCPKSFTKKHHLKTHMNFHTGLKPYHCQKCDLAFSQSSNMRTHYKKCMLKNRFENESLAEDEDNKSSS